MMGKIVSLEVFIQIAFFEWSWSVFQHVYLRAINVFYSGTE